MEVNQRLYTAPKAHPLFVRKPTNWSLNFNPNEIFEANAWAKDKNAAGGELNKSEQEHCCDLYGGSVLLQFPVTSLSGRRGQTKPSGLCLIGHIISIPEQGTVCSQEFLLLCRNLCPWMDAAHLVCSRFWSLDWVAIMKCVCSVCGDWVSRLWMPPLLAMDQ